jgi:hypothetical protein
MTRSPVARLRLRPDNQQGIATAEYAVATAAGCGFAALLIKVLTSDWGQKLIEMLFEFFLKMIGFSW